MYTLIKSYAALFAITDPLGAVPFYLPILGTMSPRDRSRLHRTAALSATVLLLVSYLFGELVLTTLSISIQAVEVVGGSLIMHLAWGLLSAHHSDTKGSPGETQVTNVKMVAWVPIGTPLLAGPGAMSYVIIRASNADTVPSWLLGIGEIVGVGLLVWIILASAGRIQKYLGDTGIKVVERLMGLPLAAMGLQMATEGMVGLMAEHGWTF